MKMHRLRRIPCFTFYQKLRRAPLAFPLVREIFSGRSDKYLSSQLARPADGQNSNADACFPPARWSAELAPGPQHLSRVPSPLSSLTTPLEPCTVPGHPSQLFPLPRSDFPSCLAMGQIFWDLVLAPHTRFLSSDQVLISV